MTEHTRRFSPLWDIERHRTKILSFIPERRWRHVFVIKEVKNSTELALRQTNASLGESSERLDEERRAIITDGRDRSTGVREEAYAQAALDNIGRELAKVAPGGRNIELNNAALKMGHMVAAGWIGRGTVEARLFDAATTCGLTKDDGAHSVRATIKSGLDAGKKEPHEPRHVRPLNGNKPNGFDHKPDATVVPDTKELLSICAADVKMKVITWLWPDRFAIGKLGIIAGLPDEGRVRILSFLLRGDNRGGEWPMNEGCAPKGSVIVFSDEDDGCGHARPALGSSRCRSEFYPDRQEGSQKRKGQGFSV